SMIRSRAGDLAGGRIGRARPFRAPHHSASMAALVGGGTRPRPGEAALAHLGVQFLDELPEFNPQVLDALRQPLESGETVIARANHRISYPSRVQLIAAMNPCRCGRAGEPGSWHPIGTRSLTPSLLPWDALQRIFCLEGVSDRYAGLQVLLVRVVSKPRGHNVNKRT